MEYHSLFRKMLDTVPNINDVIKGQVKVILYIKYKGFSIPTVIFSNHAEDADIDQTEIDKCDPDKTIFESVVVYVLHKEIHRE